MSEGELFDLKPNRNNYLHSMTTKFHSAYSVIHKMTVDIKYLGEFEFICENLLECETGSIHEKNRVKKSRTSVYVRQKKCGLSISIRHPFEIIGSGTPIHDQPNHRDDGLTAFPAVVAEGLPLQFFQIFQDDAGVLTYVIDTK